jgi:hypothetical protein
MLSGVPSMADINGQWPPFRPRRVGDDQGIQALLVNLTAPLGDEALGCCGEACRASIALRTSRAVSTLVQAYERQAEDCTRAGEQTDDPVFRELLLGLALQWKLAAREEAAKQPMEQKTADHAR